MKNADMVVRLAASPWQARLFWSKAFSELEHRSANAATREEKAAYKKKLSAARAQREQAIKAVGSVVSALFDAKAGRALEKQLRRYLNGVPHTRKVRVKKRRPT